MIDYEIFFNSIAEFKAKQNVQKQRGHNDYNILTSVLKPHDEVRLHSRMIKSLLDVNGDHYQSSIFLDLFVDTLNDGVGGDERFTIDTKNCSVRNEYLDIDIYITDGRKHIIIENKIYAGDQEEQIKRYVEKIKEENGNLKYKDILVVYLSLDGREPSQFSLSDLKIENNCILKGNESISLFKSISYKNEIIPWLDKCKFEVHNITNLNEAIKQYISVVEMNNGDYKEKSMTLSSYIKGNKSIYQTALEIHKAMPLVRGEIADCFFDNVRKVLSEKLGAEWIVEIDGALSKAWGYPFIIYKKSWEGNSLIFGFEFDKKDYYDGRFGIIRRNEPINIVSEIKVKFKEEIESIGFELKSNDWWLHLEQIPDTGDRSDFVGYVISVEHAEEKFVDRILHIINKLEIDSGLLTEINKDLK